MSADASDLSAFGGDLTRLGQRAHDLAHKVVSKTAADIAADAKKFAPYRTGNLRNSIGHDITVGGGAVEAEIGPTANYGHYLEHGTSRMAPQPYLGPAFDRRVPSFEKAMGMILDGTIR